MFLLLNCLQSDLFTHINIYTSYNVHQFTLHLPELLWLGFVTTVFVFITVVIGEGGLGGGLARLGESPKAVGNVVRVLSDVPLPWPLFSGGELSLVTAGDLVILLSSCIT
jgi:hypothetical protein